IPYFRCGVRDMSAYRESDRRKRCRQSVIADPQLRGCDCNPRSRLSKWLEAGSVLSRSPRPRCAGVDRHVCKVATRPVTGAAEVLARVAGVASRRSWHHPSSTPVIELSDTGPRPQADL